MELFAVPDLPEVRAGDDLAAMVDDRVDLRDGDVLVVASTVVSKAEGRTADLAEFPPGPRAREVAGRIAEIAGEERDPRFAQAVLEESTELVLAAPIMLAETRFGHVTVNAGIDRSNVPDADLLLLPRRPTESAERVRRGVEADVDVVVSDTSGRPFRHGQRGVALGYAGLPASRDWRGSRDREGRELEATVESVVDELAAAANLVAGEGADGRPVVVVRGFDFGDLPGSDELYRDVDEDLIRRAVRAWEYD
jgi:coenzyme F420-0:L-glutamate ligase/coenzyme F420-1:gamma-L-glutamate ligase